MDMIWGTHAFLYLLLKFFSITSQQYSMPCSLFPAIGAQCRQGQGRQRKRKNKLAQNTEAEAYE